MRSRSSQARAHTARAPCSGRTATSRRPVAPARGSARRGRSLHCLLPFHRLSLAVSASPIRTVLVTGAGRRLGREIALALAAAGWQVAVHYRGSADEARQTVADCVALGTGLRFDSVQADLADEQATRALVPRVAALFGGLDAVVNSASLFEHDTAQSFGHASLQAHLLPNTAAPILLAQALHAHVASRGAEGV